MAHAVQENAIGESGVVATAGGPNDRRRKCIADLSF
jgi:hypothetical protein